MTDMMKSRLIGVIAACTAALALAVTASAADLKSPEAVKNALRILAYVQDDMSRKLTSKSYERLPHENQEFQESAAPMREAVAGEPAAFQAKVEVELKRALAAANSMADISKTNDATRITAAVAAVDAALKPLNALFPEALRPVAGQLGSGPGRGRSGPPPDLR
jgi:hypothetical protein